MRSHAKAASAATTGGMGIARSALSWLLLGALACVVLAAFASSAAAATASTSYGYQGDIGTPDTGPAGTGSEFNTLAISEDDGRVFIIRGGESTVDVLGPDGTPITRTPTTWPSSSVAVSPDGSSFYVVNALNIFGIGQSIEKYVSDGAPTPTYTLDSSWVPDSSLAELSAIVMDPTTGDLIAGAAGGTYRIDADSAAVISSFNGSTANRGPFKPRSLAVAPNGDIYAVVGSGRVEHMGPDGSWKGEVEIPQPDGVQLPGAIAVNPVNSDVAIEVPQGGEKVIKIYSAANALKETIRLPADLAGNLGMVFSPDAAEIYLAPGNGSAHVFVPGTRPGVDPPVIAPITTEGGHVTATVATAGELTSARIEYCLPSDPCTKYLGTEGESPWHVVLEEKGLSEAPQDTTEADVTGLEPNTEYLLRTTAVNEASQIESIPSVAVSFKTELSSPVVQAGEASAVTDSSAEVAGTINNTFGNQTTYHFEYGPTTSYGSNAPAEAEGIAGSERSPRTFTETLEGLQPGTTYHYRLVATNAAGTTSGEDRSFTTLAANEVAPHRAYEMVTPPDKNGFNINPQFGVQASSDGSAIVYTGFAASADALSSPLGSKFMSRRESSGWISPKPLDPPINPIRSLTEVLTHAVSPDFEHTLVVSQKALAPGAIEGAANYYMNDVDAGVYHLVGSATQAGAFSQMTGPLHKNQYIAGASDFSWIVLISRYPLLPGAPQVAMYKWTKTDGLSLVSLLPGNVIPAGNTWFQFSTGTTNRLVSDDGQTLAFSLTSGEEGVYLRSSGETEAISVSQATGGPSGVQPGIADGMSRDGRYVIFQSPSQLTDSATDSGPKVYRYDASSGELDYLGPRDGNGDGEVLGISDDGETVYFNSNNQAVVWRDGQVDVVSSIPIRLNTQGKSSPNGRYFSFLPDDGSVHLYNAETGEDTCVTCTAKGPGEGATLASGERVLSNRTSQIVTDDGHAYFGVRSALVGADHNVTSDVYEYYNGRLALISPGDRGFTALLSDITPDGNSVYFTTAEGLVGQDTDETNDLYVARIGGGFPEPPAPMECSGEACRSSGGTPPAPPNLGSSASKNPRSSKPAAGHCRRGTHKVRKNGKARCVKNKKRDTKHNGRPGR